MTIILAVLLIVAEVYVVAIALREAWHGRLLSRRALSAPISRKAD